MVEALGTIARSGTRAFMEKMEAAQGGEGATLIGQFGVGFYSAFMVADRVDVLSRHAGTEEAWLWSSDGKGTFSVTPAALEEAPKRGTRVVLHLMEDAKSYTERFNLERIVKAQSGHVPVPIAIVDKPGDDAVRGLRRRRALDQAAGPRSRAAEYTDFYRSIAGQFDEPALTVHFRAEGRHEFTALLFVPGSRPFDLFDPDRKGRIKLYVKRVFITDDAELLPRYLRFVRGLVDSADLPLNVSREMIQKSPILAGDQEEPDEPRAQRPREARRERCRGLRQDLGHLRRGAEGRHLRGLRAARHAARAGALQDHGLGDGLRSLKDYVGALKENQTAIYYLAGSDMSRLESSPQLEGFRARGVEVLLLADPVDSFWVTSSPSFDGKPFKSVTQGAADLALIPRTDAKDQPAPETDAAVSNFLAFVKTDARRRGLGRARVRPADRQRGLPGRLRHRPRPPVGEAPGRRRPDQDGRQADPRDQPATRSCRCAGGARRRRPQLSRKTPRICCSTRRACSTASSRATRAASPTGSRASSAAACRPASRRDCG